ncbi:hypothetical protein HHK36_000512 [Tetracentron sinense]|uniref:Uncharacterized protein n=1 Tax=Tetracentron sinense TaxID=13715 RepID=A0A834ZR66_TETSI|nr:hypothetical protein HHK36_000512 [Tetracentron sinense]
MALYVDEEEFSNVKNTQAPTHRNLPQMPPGAPPHDGEPSFRRSRSLAFPFLRQKTVNRDTGAGLPPLGNGSKSSVWSVFKTSKVKKEEGEVKMMRSKSVAVSAYSDSGSDVRSKERRWYFQSPMNIFRQPKTAKVVQDRSPLYRR